MKWENFTREDMKLLYRDLSASKATYDMQEGVRSTLFKLHAGLKHCMCKPETMRFYPWEDGLGDCLRAILAPLEEAPLLLGEADPAVRIIAGWRLAIGK